MTALGSAALAWAKLHTTGLPYVYAGTGPNDYDCSGLTQAAYKAVGVTLPRTSQEQRTAGQDIPLSQAQPGDLVTFSYPGEVGNPAPANHVTLYVNPTTVFAASHAGVPIGYAPMDTAHLDRVIRVGGSSAATTSADFSTQLAGGQLGTVADVDMMQLAGYQSALTLTPWGIPLNPLKLPGYLMGKGGALAGEAGTSVIQGVMTGFMDALGPLLMTMLAAGVGLGLIGLGLWRASQPARDSANQQISQAAPLAMAAA
jgi:hypothetical protein